MAEIALDILSDAIARNSTTVLSLPSAGILRHHKTRFLDETPDGLWVESVPSEHALIDQLIATSVPCGITFKVGEQKLSFVSTVLKTQPDYQLNAHSCVPALLIARPAELKTIQRRAAYRARPQEGISLAVKLWRIPDHVPLKNKPVREAELMTELRDISQGGIGVTLLPREDQPPKVLPDERVRILLRHGEEELLMEGRTRSVRPGAAPDTLTAGIQFKKLEEDLEGRQILSTLTKIIADMNREEARRQSFWNK